MSSQQPKYELIYLPAKGKANLLRIMLADQAIDYKYTEMGIADWPAAKTGFPFKQLPVLVVNGVTQIAQSHTIARYLAREHGLLGSNSLEQAQVEMWVDQTLDLRNRFLTMLHTNYEAGLKPFLDWLPTQLELFETRLATVAGGGQHLVLGRQTLADYALFDVLFYLQLLTPGCIDHAPSLKAFYTSYAELPNIKAYMSTDAFKRLRATGSPHLV